MTAMEEDTTILEKDYVYHVYETIAPEISKIHQRAWPSVRQFLKELPEGSLIADIGCGNGKYLPINNKVYKVGLDVCQPLLDIIAGQDFQLIVGNNLCLPFRDGIFDAVLSIGVIHHFASKLHRIRALMELARILCYRGKALIYVWAYEQKHRKFDGQDILVPWHHYGTASSERLEKTWKKSDAEREFPSLFSEDKVSVNLEQPLADLWTERSLSQHGSDSDTSISQLEDYHIIRLNHITSVTDISLDRETQASGFDDSEHSLSIDKTYGCPVKSEEKVIDFLQEERNFEVSLREMSLEDEVCLKKKSPVFWNMVPSTEDLGEDHQQSSENVFDNHHSSNAMDLAVLNCFRSGENDCIPDTYASSHSSHKTGGNCSQKLPDDCRKVPTGIGYAFSQFLRLNFKRLFMSKSDCKHLKKEVGHTESLKNTHLLGRTKGSCACFGRTETEEFAVREFPMSSCPALKRKTMKECVLEEKSLLPMIANGNLSIESLDQFTADNLRTLAFTQPKQGNTGMTSVFAAETNSHNFFHIPQFSSQSDDSNYYSLLSEKKPKRDSNNVWSENAILRKRCQNIPDISNRKQRVTPQHFRYYHVFRDGELVHLISTYIKNLHIVKSFSDHGNWCAVVQKIKQ